MKTLAIRITGTSRADRLRVEAQARFYRNMRKPRWPSLKFSVNCLFFSDSRSVNWFIINQPIKYGNARQWVECPESVCSHVI